MRMLDNGGPARARGRRFLFVCGSGFYSQINVGRSKKHVSCAVAELVNVFALFQGIENAKFL